MTEAQAGRRPRLLVLTSTYPRWRGDPEPGFVHELARRLAGRFDVTVLAPHAAGADVAETLDGVQVRRFRYAPRRWQTLVNDGGIVANLKRRPLKYLLVPLFLAAQLWATWRLLRQWRPALVHAHWLVPQGVVAALLVRGRAAPAWLVTSHGADLYALRAAPLQALKRWVAGRADALTVVSEAMLGELSRLGVEAGRASVRPMGVDLQARFTPDPTVPRSPDQILFVGRLVEKKGVRHLLDALPAVQARRPGARLVIAGFGPEEVRLRAHAVALGLGDSVEFLGAVAQADLPGLYRRAAVFVAPFVEAASGDQEGLGLVMVEAAGCGCPVVASDLPAVRDVLDDRAPPGDATGLARAILAVLEGDAAARQARSEALRQRLLERFDWASVATGYGDLLASLAQGRRP